MKYYMKNNVLLEPLYNKWYAWSYLISPSTAPLFVVNAHVNIMKSYAANPSLHAKALENPKMLGGPFIDYQGGRVAEVQQLLAETIASNADMFAFDEAVKNLYGLLISQADGSTLETLYDQVPEILRGFVELVYDVNNQASFRFIEALLYRSVFYKEHAQSFVLSEVVGDYRSFLLSTPRLQKEGQLHLPLPFKHSAVDFLARLHEEPKTLPEIQGVLGLTDIQRDAMLAFLTPEKPRRAPDRNYTGDGVRIRYFGHACVLLQTADINILIDPFISYDYATEIERFTFSDLPDVIDYILITHNHQDHVLLEVLLQLRYKVKTIVVPSSGKGNLEDPSLRLMLKNIGFNNVIDVDDLEEIEIAGGSIMSLPFLGEHADLNIRTKAAHLVRLKGNSFLLAADSSNLEIKLYERLHQVVGNIDVIFLGMESEGAPLSWLYGPLIPNALTWEMDQTRRLNGSDYERGFSLIRYFNPKSVYIYAMGMEPWTTFILAATYEEDSKPIRDSDQLIGSCKAQGIHAERMYLKKELFVTATEPVLTDEVAAVQ
jgi:L-ascorbate metabolism protein UlaG (beta-lactamase superfamily)